MIGNDKYIPLVEVYNISSKKMICNFLAIGNGPNEVLTIGNIQYVPQKKELLVADLFKRKLFSYQLEDILTTDSPKPTVIYERKVNSPLMFDKLYIGKDFLVAESRDPKGRILLLDADGSEAGYYLAYPDKEKTDRRIASCQKNDYYADEYLNNEEFNAFVISFLTVVEFIPREFPNFV